MNALARFDTSALNRALVGFDRMFDNFETRFANQLNTNYPPYNVIKTDEDTYFVELAVAGFNEEELDVSLSNRVLTIKGERKRDADAEWQYLHRGIASRDFERTFPLNPTGCPS